MWMVSPSKQGVPHYGDGRGDGEGDSRNHQEGSSYDGGYEKNQPKFASLNGLSLHSSLTSSREF